jgi:hypothetical protein
MLDNHHANDHRAGAGRDRCGSAQDPPQRMAGQQERNDDEHDARRTTTGHQAVARTDRAKRMPPAATDETTRLAGLWVLAPGPDGRARLEQHWQVVDQRPHTLHGGAGAERSGGEPSILEHTKHKTVEDTMKRQPFSPTRHYDPVLMLANCHLEDLEREVEHQRLVAQARAARPRGRSPLTVLVQWLRTKRLARHRTPVGVDAGPHPSAGTRPAPPPSSLRGRSGIGISDM